MIDTHCHVSDNLEEVVNNMKGNLIIFSGASLLDNINTKKATMKYPNVYGTLGFHPDEANNISEKDISFLKEELKKPKIVGIGEIGLDYYHDVDKEAQKILFRKQLDIAREYNMPVTIHSRDAAKDTLDILKEYPDLKKVLHCYSYSLEMALEFIKIGCYFGIGGVLTFKNARTLVEVVENIDLKYLLLETDSPYLSPEPYRGKPNQPANISLVAKKISEIKNISVEEVYDITTKNACEIYNIKI